MEQVGVQLYRETISCSICLDLLKHPVTIPCGHNYCMSCIKTHWNEENQRIRPRCPQCRQTFTPRPVLMKNTMLAVLVEELKKTGLEAAAADHCYAGDEDVACDVCTGRKLKAVKSCLQCLASYCKKHLQRHYDAAPLKKHKLVEPSKKLQDYVCSRHDEVMKMFCRTDQQCICYLCCMDEHKGHDTVSTTAERTERQKELEDSRQKILQRIQRKEKDVKVLQQEVEAISRSADEAVEKSEKTFTELIRLMEKRRSDVKQQIRSQKQTEVSRAKELQKELEQEITELRRKDTELEKLSHTQDHNWFLHIYPSVSKLSEDTDSSSIKMRRLHYFEDVTAAVSELRDKLQHSVSEECSNISLMVTQVDVLLSKPPPEPQTRDEFLKYSRQITLDPNTANTLVYLSEDRKTAIQTTRHQKYPAHSDRFLVENIVLSRQCLTGRCYWEVEVEVVRRLKIIVAYKSLKRDGYIWNEDVWQISLTKKYGSCRIGVYLDHSAGFLSFYSVSDTMTLLHRVQTTFTEPLYVGLWFHMHGESAKFCDLKKSEVI